MLHVCFVEGLDARHNARHKATNLAGFGTISSVDRLRPTFGTAVVAGFDVSQEPEEIKRGVGLVPDIPNLFPRLSARNNLEFMGKLYGLDKCGRIDSHIIDVLCVGGVDAASNTFFDCNGVSN